MKKLEEYSIETQKYHAELENIATNDPVFKSRLNEEDKKKIKDN